MNFYRSLSLKWKLMLPFGLLTLLWAATGTFLLTKTALDRAETRVDGELQQQARNAGTVFADSVAGQIELVRLAANTEGVAEATTAGDIDALGRLLDPLLQNSRAGMLAVVDPSGREVFVGWRSGVETQRPGDSIDSASKAELLNYGDSGPADKVISLGKTIRGNALFVSGRIRSGELTVGYLIVGTQAESLLYKLTSGGGGGVAIYSPNGNRVASSANLPDLPVDVITSTGTTRARAGAYEIAVGPLIARDSVVARLAVFQKVGDVISEARRTAAGIAFLGMLALAGVVGLGLVVARAITRPLERMALTATRIAEGDLTQRARVRAGDEIGLLGKAFNAMTDRLQASYEELERRVEERTEELRMANVELARAGKAKSEFLANMSHELRTPLNAIIGYAEVLADPFFGSLKPAEVRKQAKIIHKSGQHLLNLINDVLDLSKIEAEKLDLRVEEISVREMVRDVIRVVEPMAAAKEIRLRSKLSRDVDTLHADQKRLRQILLNLLSNAVKFTPDRGSVLVESHKEGDFIVVSVTDTGIGISPDDHEKIFEKFLQVDGSYARKQEGTGLGLALTRELVELHGGKITLESREGQGSRFRVFLPVKRPGRRQVAKAS